MKNNSTLIAGVIAALLLVALVVVKFSDNSQIEAAVTAFTDVSNRLDTATAQIAERDQSLLTFSNNLAAVGADACAFSNQLHEAQIMIDRQKGQLTVLNGQAGTLARQNQQLNQELAAATNEIAVLGARLTLTEGNLADTKQALAQSQKEYGLLSDRLRQDVAERLVVERKFNNPVALQDQLRALKQNPAGEITADRIYAGLNVEVHSNGVVRVLSPD